MLASVATSRTGSLAHRILSHTADTGVEASAADLPGLVVELATGMFESMATLRPGTTRAGVEIEIEASGPTPEDMVVETLSELLYESEVEDLFLLDFAAQSDGSHRVRVKARGVPFSDVEMRGPPIKAVTYHDIEIVQTGDTCHGRVYFDV